MNTQLPDFNQANVLIVGDVMLDRYYTGSTKRISPEAPVPVVNVQSTEDRAGGAANVASSIAALGGKVKLLGLSGDDEASDSLDALLCASTVEPELIRVGSCPTIIKLRVMSHCQQLLRLDFEQPYQLQDAKRLQSKFSEVVQDYPVVVFSDYAKGTLSDVQTLIKLAKTAGAKVLIDPKGSDFSKYRGADLITPNLSEFEAVAGSCPDDETLVNNAYKLIDEYDLGALLITRSEKGMTLVANGCEPLHLPTTSISVSDVTGAGDTVVSTLASCIATGCELPVACKLANLAAGVVVTKVGTSTVSRAELASASALHGDSGLGIFSQRELKLICENAKHRGERIVMTNGCFDILHAGHVSYLNSAAKLGDRLIVAVNADASVKALKGPDRPVNDVNNRMQVIAALGAVDWVVEFSDETPEALIADILPDVLVKGGDYKVEEIAGHKQVLANNGEVIILQFEEGYSTSKTIASIKET